MGAIIGDIVGSVYEWHNIKTKDFPLFRDDCFFTDDTVMTIAVAEAVMNGGQRDDFIDAMKKYGRMYPEAGYGGRFGAWLFSDSREPYNSFGNGSAMRVSPCGWTMDILVNRVGRHRFPQVLNCLMIDCFFLGKGFIMGANQFGQLIKYTWAGYSLYDFV